MDSRPWWPKLVCKLRVIHTMAYFKGTFPLDLKGRFYAIVFLRPKWEILRHDRRSVHNRDILRRYFGVYLPRVKGYENYNVIHKGEILRQAT